MNAMSKTAVMPIGHGGAALNNSTKMAEYSSAGRVCPDPQAPEARMSGKQA